MRNWEWRNGVWDVSKLEWSKGILDNEILAYKNGPMVHCGTGANDYGATRNKVWSNGK